VSVRTPDRAVWAAGPPIETALRELCENAIEHNDHERLEVTIAVTQSDEAAEQVTLTVADNGPGVPEYERDVLRAGGETPLRHGSGLGLWVASWIATGLGGELRIVEDTSRGAVIALTFPIRDAPDEESKEGKHRDSVGPKGTL
jgi:signal transduction histidine kinase